MAAVLCFVCLRGGGGARAAAAARAALFFVERSATAVRARAATRLPRWRFVACSTAVRPFARGRAAREGRTVGRGDICFYLCAVDRKNVGRAGRGDARQERFYERWLPLLSAARPRKRLAAAGPAAGRLENSL